MRAESFSSMSTFFQCPLKYRYRYVDKIQGLTETEALKKGRKVHELIASRKKTKNKEADYALSLIDAETRGRKREFLKSLKTPRLRYRDEKTKINYIESFEEKFGLTRGLKSVLFDDPRAIYRGVIDYYKISFILDRFERPVSVEIEITDWKTGKPKFLKKQINSYALMLLPMFSQPKIYGRIVNVTEQKEKKWEITEEILKKTRETLFRELDIIHFAKKFKGKPSRLCFWCEYKDICPLYVDEKEIKERLTTKELPSFMKF